MRGVVSGGGLTALHDLGMRDLFDATYGSSAGAMNLTYFLAGQGCRVDVKGCRVDVKGCRVDVKGCHVDVKGCRVDVKGCRVEFKGCRVDVWQPEGARAYVDDLSCGAFLDMKRLAPSKKIGKKWRNEPPPRPALDLSVLLDDVMGVIKPLNWDAIIKSPVPLKVRAAMRFEPPPTEGHSYRWTASSFTRRFF
eukprot:8368859-Pyramimonas_sp.AAC.1